MSDCCGQNKNDKLLCYCFGITEKVYLEALKKNKQNIIKDFVIYQTKNNHCHCVESNPSKKCCLKDFKKLESF
jgi:hypothetical protein